MLKNRVKKVRKGLFEVFPSKAGNTSYELKYRSTDWTEEDIRKVIFPERREFFDPDNEGLRQKWNETDWTNSEYLSLLTVPELKKLEVWLEQKEGVTNA